jgi:hypothetical protein
MSKLIDKLNGISKTISQPIGFTTSRSPSEKPRMLLIAGLTLTPKETIKSLTDYSNNADALLIHITKSSLAAGKAQEVTKSLPEIPWGLWLENFGRTEIVKAGKAGSDFMVIPVSSNVAAMPQDDKSGRIVQVEPSFNENTLKAVSELKIDAVLLTDRNPVLTWHYLMLIQRFASLLTKPLLVTISTDITADELQILWESGAAGVLFEVNSSQQVTGLRKVRQSLNSLTMPIARKKGSGGALLPNIDRDRDTAIDIDDEED